MGRLLVCHMSCMCEHRSLLSEPYSGPKSLSNQTCHIPYTSNHIITMQYIIPRFGGWEWRFWGVCPEDRPGPRQGIIGWNCSPNSADVLMLDWMALVVCVSRPPSASSHRVVSSFCVTGVTGRILPNKDGQVSCIQNDQRQPHQLYLLKEPGITYTSYTCLRNRESHMYFEIFRKKRFPGNSTSPFSPQTKQRY